MIPRGLVFTLAVLGPEDTGPGTSGGSAGTTDPHDAIAALVGTIQWVRAKYREFKLWLATRLVAALAEGWKAALTIVALVAASIVVGYIWKIAMDNAVFVAVAAAIENIGKTIASIAAFLHIDLLIALVQLGIMVNSDLYDKLAPLYDELGSFAEELGLDIGYITTFLEVDRAILMATYQFAPFGFIKADSEYVVGLSAWLKKLGLRMADYAANPQLIFTDIQSAIIAQRIQSANAESARIWAAIDFAGDWVRDKGEVLVTLANELDAARRNLPPEIQAAIKPWFDAAIARVDTFKKDFWDPFWKNYQTLTDAIEDAFLKYDLDIEELQRRIDDPLDWLRSLLGLPESDQATLKLTLDEFFGKLFPARLAVKVGEAGVIADGMADWERRNAALVPLSEGGGLAVEPFDVPEVPGVVVVTAWYEEVG